MRKPLRRSTKLRPEPRPINQDVMVWMSEQLASDPALRRRVGRVLAALRKERTVRVRRRRRAS